MKSIVLKSHEVIHLRDTGSVIAWRVVKPQPKNMVIEGVAHLTYSMDPAEDGDVWYDADCINPGVRMECPYGRTGEVRWVKETFRFDGIDHPIALSQQDMSEGVYRADLVGDRMIDDCPWTPSTHMPRWASRFTVTLDVGLKRIQEVAEEEAKMSGIRCPQYTGKPYCTNCGGHESLCHRTELINTIAERDGDFNSSSYFWKITCTLTK